MGTSCEIVGVREDGTTHTIHVSADGYLTGVGLKLFRFYDTPEKVAALFAQDTHAPSLEADPADIDWGDWDASYRGRPVADVLAAYAGYDDGNDDPEPGGLGLYVHAHGKWAAPSTVASMKAFIETGDSPDVITREMLIAEGADESEFEAIARRPHDEHVGVLKVELLPGDQAKLSFREDGQRGTCDISFSPRFASVTGAVTPDLTILDLDGARVTLRSDAVAVHATIGGVESGSGATMSIRSLHIHGDAGGMRLFIEGRLSREVATLQEASVRYEAVRDESGEGASTFPDGDVLDADGRSIARISYNGRVWPPGPYDPAATPLWDNRSKRP